MEKKEKQKKVWPSVWIQKQLETVDGRPQLVWDVSVKLNPMMNATHRNFKDRETAEKYCVEKYGRFDSVRENC